MAPTNGGKRKGHSAKRSRAKKNRSATRSRKSDDNAETQADDTLAIVALGASAGGLAALQEFFEHVPADSGLGFVVVTHRHAGQQSMLAELLGRKTTMPVVQVSEITQVEPNHVYTARPGLALAISNGMLTPIDAHTEAAALRLPVDYLFRSLAHDQKERAIGVLLSGTGSDGTLGLEEIKAELGLVMVQTEASAQCAGMPRSAITTGLADFVLPAAEMPKHLLDYVEALTPDGPRTVVGADPSLEALQQILVLIRDRTGHDFSQYKQSAVRRRIERRMGVRHFDTVQRYVRHLQATPREVDLLFKDLLIGVTSFFRDSSAWDALSPAISDLLANKPDDYVVRAWVAGCSTGEEAYSLATLLRERMDALERTLSVQVFATDLDPTAIDVARAGAYSIGIANDVSPKRLARFFTREAETHRVKKELREMIVFAHHNLIADPPFINLDLLVCRNLMIYLDSELQRRLLSTFHYSLRPRALLFLGSSESVGPCVNLFSAVDKKWKIFRRDDAATRAHVPHFPVGSFDSSLGARAARVTSIRSGPAAGIDQMIDPMRAPDRPASPPGSPTAGIDQMINRMLLRDLVPPTIVVHERGEVIHVHGRTGLFLEPTEGPPANANVFNMARPGLPLSLTSAIRQAAATEREIVRRGVQVEANGDVIKVDVRVARLTAPEPLKGMFRITFGHPSRGNDDDSAHDTDVQAPLPDRLSELERELRYIEESHQSTIEELETANEELKSTNEELLSTNEELQSANEELETSKEEMQSLNEELQTVNSELLGKMEALSRANNDMKNLLNATNIATVFLDDELHIKRYTEQATRVIRLISTDIGRPIGDLASSLHYDRLVDDAREVLRTLAIKEVALRGEDDAHYLMRILPYRTTENVIEGLVLTFIDVTTIDQLQEEQGRLLAALRNSPASVFGCDRDLRVTWACSSVFGRPPEELVGKTDRELLPRDDAVQLIELKKGVLKSGSADRRRLDLTIGLERRTYDMYVEAERDPAGQIIGVSCLAMDLTLSDEAAPTQGGGK